MERLHDPSTNAYGRVEHVYSPCEVGEITEKIFDDEWTALGSVIAETMLETTLDADAMRRGPIIGKEGSLAGRSPPSLESRSFLMGWPNHDQEVF
jgi:hypothetical protein